MTKTFDIYSASAGSGKTYTLALQYIILCFQCERKTDFPFKHILAITFTNKAANELKSRVLDFMATLAQWSGPTHSDEHLLSEVMKQTGLNAREVKEQALIQYERMIYNYGDIHVSTIDKFVLSILRSFSKELGLSSDFNVQLDQREIIVMVRDAILNQIGTDERLTNRLVSFALSKGEDGRSWDIKADLDGYLTELLKEDGQIAMESIKPISKEVVSQFCLEMESEYKAALLRLQELQQKGTALIDSKHIDRAWFNRGKSGFINLFARDFLKDARGSTEGQRKTYLDEEKWTSKNGKPHQAEIDDVMPTLTPWLEEINDSMPEFRRLSVLKPNLLALEMLHLLDENLSLIEKEDETALLSSNNMRIARVLKENPAAFIYERVSEKFDHFLIDEFQDTSVQQWHNFLPLLSESLARNNRNIIVGDAKQAIYRWRSGEVQQFIDLPDIFGKEDDYSLNQIENQLKNSHSDGNKLSSNYRSKNEIIQFNNLLYGHLKKHLSADFESVYASQAQQTVDDARTGGYVEIVPIEVDKEQEDKADMRALSAEIILRQIAECFEDGYSPGDICFLVRKNANGQFLADFLRTNGHKVVSSDSFFLGKNRLSHLVVAMMSLIDDPEKDGPKLSILHHLTALLEREQDFQSLAERHIGRVKVKGGDAPEYMSKPFTPVFGKLDIDFDIDSYADLDLYATCEKVISDLDLDSSSMYLIELLNLCAEKGNGQGYSLREFIDFWDEKGNESSLKMPEAEDAMRIMTVHKSKGLEFPVVFLPFFGGKMKKTLNKRWVDLKDTAVPKALIGLSDSKLTGTEFHPYAAAEAEKSKLDELNVLYVATTRAEDRIYLNFETSKKSNYQGTWFVDFLSAHEENMTQGLFTYGQRQAKKVKEKSKSDKEIVETDNTLADFSKTDWRTKLRISLGKEQAFNEQMDFGTLVHDMLAKLKVNEQHPRWEEAQKIVQSIDAIPQIKQWESEEFDVKNECTLIDELGHSHRPDKVYLTKETKEAIVLDYKTGERSETHNKQVKRYKDVLQKMGYTSVSGFLLYTQELELVSVA